MKKESGWLMPIIGAIIGIVLVLIPAVIAIELYRSVFNGGLSNNSSDWSNLGSYIGGLFGPIISFITLIAVMLTVILQKKLLDEQSEQFVSMNELQERTFSTQAAQIKDAQDQAERARVTDVQNSAHTFIVLKVEVERANLETFKHSISKLTSDGHNLNPALRKQLSNLSGAANTLSCKIDSLIQLSEELVLMDFKDSETVKAHFRDSYHDIKERYRLI